MPLTNKQKKAYLKHSHRCPFCKSENIEGEAVEIDDGIAWQPIRCLDCNKNWSDLYKLIGVEEI